MLLAGLRAHDNWILCSTAGVALGDTSTRTGYTAYALRNTVAANFVLGGVLGGIGVQGYSALGAAMQVADNHLEVAGTGITVALDGCTVADNHVTQLDAATALSVATHPAGAVPTPGILISPVAGALAIGEARVLRNRVFGVGGPGISINAPVLAVAVIDNAIALTQGAGIVTGAAGQLTNAIVRGNEVFAVSSPVSPDAGGGRDRHCQRQQCDHPRQCNRCDCSDRHGSGHCRHPTAQGRARDGGGQRHRRCGPVR